MASSGGKDTGSKSLPKGRKLLRKIKATQQECLVYYTVGECFCYHRDKILAAGSGPGATSEVTQLAKDMVAFQNADDNDPVVPRVQAYMAESEKQAKTRGEIPPSKSDEFLLVGNAIMAGTFVWPSTITSTASKAQISHPIQ